MTDSFYFAYGIGLVWSWTFVTFISEDPKALLVAGIVLTIFGVIKEFIQ